MKDKVSVATLLVLLLTGPCWSEEKDLVDLVKGADLKAWADTFSVIKTSADASNHQVVWLIEARKDLSFPFDLSRHHLARFLDEDDAVLSSVIIEFKPALDYKKGERLRAFLKVPEDEETVGKTKKVIIIRK